MRPYQQVGMLLLFGVMIAAYLFAPLGEAWKFIIAGLYVAGVLLVSFLIMLERRSSTTTLLWLFLIFFVPFIGYFIYIYSGQLSREGVLFAEKRKKANEVFREYEEKTDYQQLALTAAQTEISRLVEGVADTPVRAGNEVKVLTNGSEAFPEIFTKLREATQFIHMDYYLVNSDETGLELVDILIGKATEGIKVKLMYDAAGSMSLKKREIKRLKAAGVEVHPFLPFKSGIFSQTFNFRNHRKIIVIDGEVGFVGGMNIGDEYHGISEEFPDWRDTHLRLKGGALKDLHLIFLVDWWYTTNESLFEKFHKSTSFLENRGDDTVQIVPSGPHNKHQIMRDVYTMMINSAKESILIATPYFVPSPEVHSALRIASQRGVKVKLLVPRKTDIKLALYAGQSYFPELLEDGLAIYFYEKDFMHHKIMIIDRETASVGTANMDLRSFYLNFEVNAILYGGSNVEKLLANFENDLKDASRVLEEDFSKRSVSEKIKEAGARLFAPLL